MKVIITGASGGMGRAFACECAERGYDMLLTDVNAEGLKTLGKGLKNQFSGRGVKILTYPCNLLNDGEVSALINFAKENNFQPNMLLNVAGTDCEGAFKALEPTDFERIVNVNICGTMKITHETIKIRERDKNFYILFVSSFAAYQPMPLKATYACTKRFLLDFSLALGEELKNEKIYTTAVCPSGMPTSAGCVDQIDSQGFWGRATTVKLDFVTRKSLDALLKRKKVFIPGAANKFIKAVLFFTPAHSAARYVYKRWTKAQTAYGEK